MTDTLADVRETAEFWFHPDLNDDRQRLARFALLALPVVEASARWLDAESTWRIKPRDAGAEVAMHAARRNLEKEFPHG